MNKQDVMLGLDIVFAIARRDYRNDEATLDKLEDELHSYFESCFPKELKCPF